MFKQKEMKRNFLFIFIALISITSCSQLIKSKTTILDLKIDITEINNGDLLCCLSGQTGDSALWVESYIIKYEDDKIFVLIKNSLKKTGISNPYYIEFIIPKSVETVFLGKEEVIWKRSNKKL